MATPTPSDTVAPPFAAADITCPGPVVGVRDRSCQTCPTGKYPYISNTSSSERLPIFSPSTVPVSTRRLPSAEAVMVSQLIDPAPLDNPSHRAALPSPGRSLDGTMEIPNRSDAVALPASGQPSRPGPAFGCREGLFQQPTPGEYSESTVFSSPDNPLACSPPRNLTIYYQNIRGMRTKTEKLRLALMSSDYDVVVLTETWLHGNILDSEFSAIYVRPRTTPDVYTLHAESVQQILEKATDQDVVVVVGDNKLPDLVWVFDEDVGGFLPANASSDAEVALTESFLANGLVQINFLLNNRLLDLAFVNDAAAFELLQSLNSLLPIDAPHLTFVLKLEICAHTPASESIDPVAEEFDFKRCNFETLNSRLEAVYWSTMDTAGSLDDAVTEFYDQLLNVLRDTVPVRARRFRCPSRTPPWWNSQLRNLRNQLRKARKRFVNRSSWGNKVTLSYLETEFAEQQVTSYQNYIAGVQDNLQSNPKNFWSYVKERSR
ncbi:uncharacterized protein LOC119769079 [Culex quinquefasciatus]|uniref:uncharacterized protein LOC119769079 n=1 Tax=Culex quinquefasciatus TaxID=7176 RepID=UPI0018E38F3D|nr:uncharacterized protein LOC119769079 [Culex quinquefasciatus]